MSAADDGRGLEFAAASAARAIPWNRDSRDLPEAGGQADQRSADADARRRAGRIVKGLAASGPNDAERLTASSMEYSMVVPSQRGYGKGLDGRGTAPRQWHGAHDTHTRKEDVSKARLYPAGKNNRSFNKKWPNLF